MKRSRSPESEVETESEMARRHRRQMVDQQRLHNAQFQTFYASLRERHVDETIKMQMIQQLRESQMQEFWELRSRQESEKQKLSG